MLRKHLSGLRDSGESVSLLPSTLSFRNANLKEAASRGGRRGCVRSKVYAFFKNALQQRDPSKVMIVVLRDKETGIDEAHRRYKTRIFR